MYEVHPLAEMVPEMSAEQYEQLRDDIAENGYDPAWPIWLYEDMILDGRHRARACEALGVDPTYMDYTGDSPAAFVLRSNKRRDLTPSQRAAMAAEFLPRLKEEARERQREAGKSYGRGMDSSRSQDRKLSDGHEAREEAGALVGVSGASVDRARRIKEQAPEEFEKVKAGERTVREVDNELREKRKQAPLGRKARPGERRPLDLTKDRNRQAAEAAKQRVEKVVGTCQGLAAGLPDLNVELAAQVASEQDIKDWIDCLSDGIGALRKFRGRIPTSGGTA